jgi:hypothetical protein
MKTSLVVQITGNTWQSLDIFEDIAITLNIQQQDITNITTRRSPYSRTIQIPDTANNAKVFEHYYEVNGVEFNPLNQVPCIVQYEGNDIFTGVLRMSAVIESANQRLYEVFILGEVADFTAGFKDLQLQELEWADLSHTLDYDNIVQSWECENDGASGLFNGQILYPLIHYGLDYSSSSPSTPAFSFSFGETNSFSLSGHSVPPSYFKPAIQLKSVLDRIFDKTKYTIDSEFFSSEYFTSMYMDTNVNGKLGITSASAQTNQNIFKVYSNGPNQRNPVFTNNQTNQFLPINWLTQFPDGYDPLNNFTLGTNTQIAPQNEGYFQVPYAGDYYFNIRFNFEEAGIPLGVNQFYIIANKNASLANINIGSFFTSLPQPVPALGTQGFLDLYFSASCLAGEYIKVFIFLPSGNQFGSAVRLLPFSNAGVSTPNPMWDLYQSPILTENIVDMKLGIPNISAIEFFRSMITLFNLTIEQNETNKIIKIEPFNWRFDDQIREVKDWTNILDQNSEKRIEPLSFELNKEVVFTYRETGFEFLPYEFYGQYDYVYGRKKFTTESNIYQGEKVFEIPFGSCPTSGLTGAPNFIIPQYYYFNNNQEVPYSDKPHLFFWVGNRYAYKDNLKSEQGTWFLTSGATPQAQTTYPCVSHLSTLESQIFEVISDLNFQSTFDFFGNTINQIEQFTPFTLYDTFWSAYIENLFSFETRRLTGKFFLRPIDIARLKLNDKIWVKDASYTIEKIPAANLTQKILTEVSLIKEPINYYRIDPPAPIYINGPNEPYPLPQPLFSTLCYVSQDKDLVCNGTTPSITQVYSFSSLATLNNLQKVLIDTGTSYQFLPIGTYLRETTSGQTFVVVDIFGRILETTC